MPRMFAVLREVDLEATPEQVWSVISTESGLSAWLMPLPIEPDSDEVVAFEPGKHLAIEEPSDDGVAQTMDMQIEAHGSGTRLRFEQHMAVGEEWNDGLDTITTAGWDMYLFTLAQYCRFFVDQPATYIEADGPPSSGSPDASATLLAALGLSSAAAVGNYVYVSPEGVGPVNGAIDYATPYHVGVRTYDALVRFHLRSLLDMPVGISHHVYRRQVDVAAAIEGWESWLGTVFG
jgi:uncharacterized protein YndB with AHSA1/START domain